MEAIDERLVEAEKLLSELERRIDSSLAASQTPSYDDLAGTLEQVVELIEAPWTTISHLKSVKDTEELRAAHSAVQPKVVEFETRVSQSTPVYRGWKAIKNDATAWEALSPAQKRVVDLELLSAELKGIGLEGEVKAAFNEINQKLARLSTDFSNHVLDATKAFHRRLTSKDQVAGLPESALQMMAASARARGDETATAENGPWVVTLDGPCLLSVLRYASDDALREDVYRAYVTRASDASTDPPEGGKEGADNGPIVTEILRLRAEKAKLLKFSSYAHVSLAEKMASLQGVHDLLEDLRVRCLEPAKAEHSDLEAFAGRSLSNWDINYYAERLKEAKYSIDEESVRPYLPLDAVFQGLWDTVHRLFGVTAHQVDPASVGAQVWDAEVRLFELRRDGEPVAYCFVDPFARAGEKRGGAWMSDVRGRSRVAAPIGASVRLPCAHMVCNQSPPVTHEDGTVTPSLMTPSEVRTLFHECGHALQHMLTQVDEGHVAGIRGVEWDAVEQVGACAWPATAACALPHSLLPAAVPVDGVLDGAARDPPPHGPPLQDKRSAPLFPPHAWLGRLTLALARRHRSPCPPT